MMNWRRPFGRRGASAPEIKDSRTGPLVAFSHVGRPVWTPRDYASLATEGFARNPVAYRCVRMIAEAGASCPLVVFERGERAKPEHPLVKLLARPSPEQAGVELMEVLYGTLQTAGNAYLEAAGDGVEELYALRPDRVTVIPGANGWPAGYEYAVNGRAARLMRAADGFSPVLHLKLLHPADDWYGFSPM
jgi:HK97 family phage portal protein